MAQITSLTALTEIYGAPGAASLTKVSKTVSPLYRDWIMKSRFCVLSTVGPDGVHSTPRGDDTSAVQVPDSTTILLPDWPGNKRIDALRDIVADGRASLMFMAPGNNGNPANRAFFPWALPSTMDTCGELFYAQAFIFDPEHGLSATQGMQARTGL